jgi:hypothetical protein
MPIGEDVLPESQRPEFKFTVVVAPVHKLEIVAVTTEFKV